MKRPHCLLLFLLLPLLYQCKETCHELPSLSGMTVPFTVIDSLTGANLLHKANENDDDFNIDSITIYNQDNKNLNNRMGLYPLFSTGENGYYVDFGFLGHGTGVENPYTPDSSVYFIHWNSTDSDTISLVYDYEEGRSDCDWENIRFDFFFNGKIVNYNQSGKHAGYYFLQK